MGQKHGKLPINISNPPAQKDRLAACSYDHRPWDQWRRAMRPAQRLLWGLQDDLHNHRAPVASRTGVRGRALIPRICVDAHPLARTSAPRPGINLGLSSSALHFSRCAARCTGSECSLHARATRLTALRPRAPSCRPHVLAATTSGTTPPRNACVSDRTSHFVADGELNDVELIASGQQEARGSGCIEGTGRPVDLLFPTRQR